MRPVKWILKKTVLNWERPFYSSFLYEFSKRYLDLWFGDNNFDRKTNGEYRLLSALIPKCSLVFDVGANVGDYSTEILRINPNVKIHAFEPDPDSYAQLRLLPIAANNVALGSEETTATLYRSKRATHNSLYQLDPAARPIEVKVSTLDSYCRANNISRIDFVKIDVEGYEFSVLKGAKKLLERGAIDYVQFEFSGATAQSRVFLRDFIDLFDRAGYSLHRIRATDIPIVQYAPDKERFTLTNYLAVKNGLRVPGERS